MHQKLIVENTLDEECKIEHTCKETNNEEQFRSYHNMVSCKHLFGLEKTFSVMDWKGNKCMCLSHFGSYLFQEKQKRKLFHRVTLTMTDRQ